MKRFSLTELIISIVTAELAGALSALISGDLAGIYSGLIRPPLSPPAAVFPVVWAVLYALMGASAYIVHRHEESRGRDGALRLYAVQLAVNFLWSIIFFRFRLFGAAAIAAVVLVLLVGVMILSFKRISKKAGIMNLPYLAWLIFASYLSIGVYILNR